jgi:hypothetical protein
LAVAAIRQSTKTNALRSSVALRIVNALRMQEKRGKVQRVGKSGNAIVWRMAPSTIVTAIP